jgi:hypothetical protein
VTSIEVYRIEYDGDETITTQRGTLDGGGFRADDSLPIVEIVHGYEDVEPNVNYRDEDHNEILPISEDDAKRFRRDRVSELTLSQKIDALVIDGGYDRSTATSLWLAHGDAVWEMDV